MPFCPVCSLPGFLGRANDPSTQFCAEHAPWELGGLGLGGPGGPKPVGAVATVVVGRVCIIPGCGRPSPSKRDERLCDEHYAPVSAEAVANQIARDLASRWCETPGSAGDR